MSKPMPGRHNMEVERQSAQGICEHALANMAVPVTIADHSILRST